MKYNNKKQIVLSSAINIIIAFCIFSIFSACFFVEDSIIASSSGYKAIYRGNENNNNVSLCINVYWGTEYIDEMLEILKNKNVKVTFFVGGSWASKNIELLKKMNQEGHEIANHGYYHKDHKNISLERNIQEIEYNHKLIKENLGIDMSLFMPPSGSYGLQTLEAAEKLDYTTIMWSKDTIDWRDHDTNMIYKRATKNLQNGDLILMHPTQCTKDALANIIMTIKSSGFNIVTVSQNIL